MPCDVCAEINTRLAKSIGQVVDEALALSEITRTKSIFFRFSERLRNMKTHQSEMEKIYQELQTHQNTHQPTQP